MSPLVEQIEALLALNAKGAVSHRIPGLAVELLTKAAQALSPPLSALPGDAEVVGLVARLLAAIRLAESMGVRGSHPSNIYNLADEAASSLQAMQARAEAAERELSNMIQGVSDEES